MSTALVSYCFSEDDEPLLDAPEAPNYGTFRDLMMGTRCDPYQGEPYRYRGVPATAIDHIPEDDLDRYSCWTWVSIKELLTFNYEEHFVDYFWGSFTGVFDQNGQTAWSSFRYSLQPAYFRRLELWQQQGVDYLVLALD